MFLINEYVFTTKRYRPSTDHIDHAVVNVDLLNSNRRSSQWTQAANFLPHKPTRTDGLGDRQTDREGERRTR